MLGPDGCARLQSELTRHTAGWAARCTRQGWLAFTPPDAREEIAALTPPGLRLFPQEGDDLGERLRHASELVFALHSGPLAVIGTDAPELSPVHIRSAERALADGHGACLIPTFDGGYALIALTRPVRAAFGLPAHAWGGSKVLELTLAALDGAACSWVVLEPVRDLDTPEDSGYIAADPRCPAAVWEILKHPSAV
jgi:glycosyltransferase A (GT-A) superfamily protein (DUF2064 family)